MLESWQLVRAARLLYRLEHADPEEGGPEYLEHEEFLDLMQLLCTTGLIRLLPAVHQRNAHSLTLKGYIEGRTEL